LKHLPREKSSLSAERKAVSRIIPLIDWQKYFFNSCVKMKNVNRFDESNPRFSSKEKAKFI